MNLEENLGPSPSIFHWRCQSLTGKWNSPDFLTIKSVFAFSSKRLCALVTCVLKISTLLPPPQRDRTRKRTNWMLLDSFNVSKQRGRGALAIGMEGPAKIHISEIPQEVSPPTFQEVLSSLTSAPNFSASCCSFLSLSRDAWSFSWERGITPESSHELS